MELKDWLLPTLAFVLGVVSLLTDTKKSRSVTHLLFGSLVVAGVITVIVNVTDTKAARDRKANDDRQIKDLIAIAKHASGNTDSIVEILTSYGYSKTIVGSVATSIQADRALQLVNSAVAAEKTARPKVYYFPKDVDGVVVTRAMKDAGFDVTPRQPVIKDTPTNMIWVGDKVSLADVKFVALTLVRAGVKLKGIRRFFNSKPGNENLVHVGAYQQMEKIPVLGVEEILQITHIMRDTEDSWPQ